MTTKLNLHRYFWIMLLALLVACGPLVPAQVVTPTAINVPTFTPVVEAPTEWPTFTPLPTFPPFSTPTNITPSAPTQTPTAFILPSETDSFAKEIVPYTSDRFRKVYVKDGNLYIQDGISPQKQLTHSGEDRDPVISSDGKKIAFYRGKENDNVYSINADGSQEQLIVKSKSLPVLGQGEIKALTFFPNSHILYFNTYLCNPRGGLYYAPACTVGIYNVDTDTTKISQVLSGLSGNAMHERNFELSPNKQFISVATSGHIDLYYPGGELVYQNAILYQRTKPYEFLPFQYWLPDSSGLIAVVATDAYYEPGTWPATFAVVRYTVGGTTVQIPLGATIMHNSGCNFSISPDKNWIYFIGNETGDRTKMPTLFMGNLKDGSTKPINWEFSSDCPSVIYENRWSLDSKYYAFERYFAGVDGTTIPIDGSFIEWIDSTHYYYVKFGGNKVNVTKTYYIGEIGGKSVSVPEGFNWPSTFVVMPPTAEP